MLEHFLTYISQDLGMDHLSLLDLRSLEPPAALGNNLIMIIGTARSEKHLNTAANRCCRWLRTNFKLRPHADGLLGRNELKLKVKRKNKRTKLLASVGSKEKPDLDDGIRTGWVCVHVGNVEPATTGEDKLALPVDVPSIVVEDENQEGRELLEPSEEDIRENLDQGEGFVGFGEATDGLTIVLQMFTEDKRSEVDLETLWSDILGKFQRRANNLKNLEPTENIHGSSPG
jgi:ribosomal silencing factor RsfS